MAVRRADGDRALLRSGLPGEDPQQRGLAGAVRPDEADDVAGGEHEVETGEQDAGAVAGGRPVALTVALISSERYPGWRAAPAGRPHA